VRIVSVVGTRPQLIKAAALQPALRVRHSEIFVDTGQHFDDSMAGAFFRELGLPRPDHSLGISGGGHGDQTGRMLVALEPILAAERPDAVLVYGDTNSTLAGGLAAAKLGIKVAHVEAGLRSFDRRMPEELNRILVDHLSAWLFAPTSTAVENLRQEGVTEGVVLVGDLMQDLVAATLPSIRAPEVLGAIGRELGLALEPGGYLFATIHRAENRAPAAIGRWAALLGRVALPGRPVVLALHPGTRAVLERADITVGPNVAIIGPQSYRTSLTLQLHSAAVLTDSGGVQREAGWLGVPCLVLRSTTEWIEATADSSGRIVIVGLEEGRAVSELERIVPGDEGRLLASRRATSARVETAAAADAIATALADDASCAPRR
jgi:UDP-GlcNAc3NAcA epimerase